jgi:hypothetical protein
MALRQSVTFSFRPPSVLGSQQDSVHGPAPSQSLGLDALIRILWLHVSPFMLDFISLYESSYIPSFQRFP